MRLRESMFPCARMSTQCADSQHVPRDDMYFGGVEVLANVASNSRTNTVWIWETRV